VKWIALALVLLGLAAMGSQAPAQPTDPWVNPTTVPVGGEPGLPAGPPNPGWDNYCGPAPYDADVRGVVRVDTAPIKPCEEGP
jgi:hypothetical protein